MSGFPSLREGPAGTTHMQAVRPRQVFCPIEAQHRDLRVADDAVIGRFRYAGVTLDLGHPPDWRHDGLADDEEWHIEWSKFYFGLDLAHAFSVTGDGSYLEAWQRLVTSWIDQREPDCDPPEVTARRVQNWLYAWQGFDRAPAFAGLERELEERLLTSMAEQVQHVASNLTPERNHRTLELFALLVVSLGLPVLDPGGVRASRAWADLRDNLLTDVWSDGVHRERSTHYHLIALRSFVAARVNITRFGGHVPVAYDERLRAALRFGMHLHRPDGLVPALSDSDSESYLDLLELAADSLDAEDLRYVATRGSAGTPPTQRCADFPVGGYYVQRSGWGEQEPLTDERFLVFGCGPLGDGGHGHYDALAVEAYGHGHPLVVDPGRYTYAEGDPNWRHWFKGTAAHNTLTVDGLDQQPYRRGKPKGALMRSHLLDRRSVAGVDLVRGEVVSPAYDAIHQRTVIFVAGAYWLILDTVRSDRPHDYALRWHLADDQPLDVAGPGKDHVRVTTPTVLLDIVGPMVVTAETGWVSTAYGVKKAAPVVVASVQQHESDLHLVTLLAPRRAGEAPTVRSADPATGDVVVERADGTTDHVRWHAPHLEAQLGCVPGEPS